MRDDLSICRLIKCWKQTRCAETRLDSRTGTILRRSCHCGAPLYQVNPVTRAHVDTYVWHICFVNFPIHSLILPSLSTLFFSKECTPEHPYRLVSIHLVHLTRIAALFLFNQSEGPLKNCIALQMPTPLSLLLFWRLQDSGVMILGTGIPRNRVLWFVPVSMVPPGQREILSRPGVFVKPVKRWLCILRSRAHRGQNSSVTLTELGLCSTTDGGESVWGGQWKHRSGMFGSWLNATYQLGAQGTGSPWRKKQACVHIYINKHALDCKDTHK